MTLSLALWSMSFWAQQQFLVNPVRLDGLLLQMTAAGNIYIPMSGKCHSQGEAWDDCEKNKWQRILVLEMTFFCLTANCPSSY